MLREEPIKARWQIAARAKDYNQLLKPNLSGMVVFSSVIGYLMAPNVHFIWNDMGVWRQIITLFLGGMLVTGGANTINQILEHESDSLMKRTRTARRPYEPHGGVDIRGIHRRRRSIAACLLFQSAGWRT